MQRLPSTIQFKNDYSYVRNNAISGFGAIAIFAFSVMGSFSTVCVSALTPNAVDKITSIVRL